MKFMATEPWYYNNVYYPASNSNPHVFEFPDDDTPSIKWWPLDKCSAEKLAEIKSRKNLTVRLNPIPNVEIGSHLEVIPSPKGSVAAIPLPLGLKIKVSSKPSVEMARPSDSDPV